MINDIVTQIFAGLSSGTFIANASAGVRNLISYIFG